jgi:hypothetical protein
VRADDGRKDATPIEDVGVADAEKDIEDHVSDKGTKKAHPERDCPRGRPAHVPKKVTGHQHPRDDPRHQAEKNRT